MNRYLDVGVVGIQGYLTQEPSLTGRRGASTMINKATRTVRDGVPNGASVHAEAGEVDGVVSLVLDPGVAHDAVARSVLTRLRRELPAADLTSALWTGPSYPQARTARAPEWSTRWVAAVPEWPLAKPCDRCRNWPALVETHRVEEEGRRREEHYCRDCTQRRKAAGRARDPRRVPGPERALLARYPDADIPDDFEKLAGGAAVQDRTHIATLWADGNAIGDCMAHQDDKARLAAAIHDATWTAVGKMLDDPATVPVIPHLIGGDDVLVSVPAHRIWPALKRLLPAFGDALTGDPRPSLSAGVVIHHRSHPLADVVDIASQLLRAAKRAHPGQATLGWHSITHDGPLPTDRPPLPVADLIDRWKPLDDLAELSGSARHELATLHRGDQALFDAHVRRLGITAQIAPFRQGPIGLDDALAMVPWWET
jgi:hypothetical protein